MSADEDDRSPSRLGSPHHLLNPWTADDGVAYQERLDRSGVDGLADLRGTVRARVVRRNRFEEPLDESRLVADPTISEDLRADAGLQRLVDPLHPRVGRAMAVDLRRQAGVTGFPKLEESVPAEPPPNQYERPSYPDHPELD